MSDADKASSSQDFEGSMFLYDRPALLSKEDHGHLGIVRPDSPFDFVKGIKAVPIVVSEVQTVQKFYPIVFSEFENPMLLAMLGIIDDRNRYVDDDGNWASGHYVPSYIRCHPFALATRAEDEFAVIIDESSSQIGENPDVPFFENDKISEALEPRLDLCGHYRVEQEKTDAFCRRIKDLGLLNGQRVQQKMSDGSEAKIVDYVTIDGQKLLDLDKDKLHELHTDGALSVMFAQLFSLENWNRLIARRNEQLQLN